MSDNNKNFTGLSTLLNNCTFGGWATDLPEHGQTGELQWCNFSIGLIKDNPKDDTTYIKISAYYNNAEKVKTLVGKGTFVIINCSVKTKKWENKNGEKRESSYYILKSIFAPISLLGVNKEQESITLKEAFDELPFTP